MGNVIKYLNRIVAASLAVVTISLPAWAEDNRLDALFAQLSAAEPAEARRIAAEIELEWSRSGSAAMDLLLRRGEDAIEAGDLAMAIEHLSAAIDHAPDFAEAWHLRSVAFFQQERYGLALHDIEQALAREPRHFNAMFGLGVLMDRLGEPALAREALLRAHAIHPHHKDVSETLERVSRKLGGADL
ncbi:tetratricopeptide repeat protein [Roseovarius autotrophicus]|uniref:tetratricopeptide repeat protein n=1 Tax=Roseovarius autotrophicus TaxID=2824121 RepID=UPI0019F885A0|nr:tetratricopeptide repeat protein [Roseovarius autotrophicus]MBE0452567.1 tetratricopeptide repeat protein [Roseovarius sp.]